MECSLCQEDRDLCDSHIVSSFNYTPLREGRKPNFFELPTDPRESISIVQDGPTEKLLCRECEQLRSTWERYFSLLWHEGRVFPDYYPVTLTDLDYAQLKLYQMSTLFLAAEAGHDFFEQVRLTDARCEQLRKMLLSESPGPPAEFGCVMLALVHDEISDPRAIASSGHTLQHSDLRLHQFVFAGFLWAYVDGDTDLMNPELKEKFVNRRGHLRIGSINPRAIGLFEQSITNLKEQGKLDKGL